MAEDHPQRPFRSTDPQGRATPAANNPAAASNDPLAELARLIGQSDPFGEFGRDSAAQQRAAQPQAPNQPEPMLRALVAQAMPHGANSAQAGAGEHGAESYGAEDYTRQPYGSAPLAGGGDVYHMQDAPVPGYDDQAGYQEAGYDPGPPPYAGDEHDYQEYYDDIPPPRRRMGVLAIAAVFALAVIGTAGAFGYRALFGSVSSGPPPVIKADSKPAKIVPEKDKNQAKLINDRINGVGGAQKLVSREEQPVDLNKDKPAGVIAQGEPMATAGAGAMETPALGSGVIGPDPRKIHTITIRPNQLATQQAGAGSPADQANVADVTQTAPQPTPKPAQPLAPAQPASQRATHEARQPAPAPAPRRTVTHRAAPKPTRRVASVPPSNAPLSLNPNAEAPARTATRVARAPTSLAPASSAQPASSASGGYAVQVSSRHNRADAQAALSRMQSRYASVIGGQQVMIRRVDLAGKGVYYRAMIGPFGSAAEASRLCSRLKAAGGSCFVQKI